MIFDAIQQGDVEQVRALLSADPSLHGARTADGASPVLWAVYTRHAELAPLLLGPREPDFFEACALGRADRAAELLAANPMLANAHSPDGFTGLGFACFFRHSGIAALLLDLGANPSLAAMNAIGVSPLHSAAAADLTEIVKMLLDRGANPNASDPAGMTPLHTAAGHGNAEIMRLLLMHGADPRAAAKDGKTPADIALRRGHPEAVTLLETAAC